MPEKEKENRIIVITGPTAVGKTSAAVKLARQLGTEVISADSMQVYRGMDIGTAKVTAEEMDGVPHSLIDCMDPSEDYNVAAFQKMARSQIERIHSEGKIPIVCGGTGFYIQALLYDIDFQNEREDHSVRQRLEKQAESEGIDSIYEELKRIDPEYALVTPKENLKRCIRAIEYYRTHGEKFSEHNRAEYLKRNHSIYDAKIFVLYDEREKLRERIDQRVDRMMEAGLEEEVRRLIDSGVPAKATSMQGIGYKQLLEYFSGKVSLSEAVDRIKIDSRHYAKRQLVWFKTQEKDAIWIDAGKGNTVEQIKQYLW